MYILVLESSTTSAKAMLYSTTDGVIKLLDRTYDKMYQDTTVHDGEAVFHRTAALGKRITENREVDLIVLSATWHSLMLCDQQMKPVTPVFTWAYTGAHDLCKKKRADRDFTKYFYSKTGCMVNAIYPVFKLMFLKEQGYDLGKYFIMDQGTYNFYRLTGKRAVMDSMASGSGLFNIHAKQYDADILKVTGIKESQLSQIVTFRETKPLSKEGAGLLELKEGIPVITAGPDGGLNQVGAGALKEGIMTFSVGTSGALRLSSGKPVISENMSTWCYMSPYSWLSGVATSGCCNCVDWIKNRLFQDKLSYSGIESNFNDKLSNPPVFLPFLYGERCPGWNDERSAVIYNLRPEHTAYDIYHSVLEGTLYNLYQSYLELIRLKGIPDKIKLSGGILNSKYWTQMCADIFNMEMEIDQNQQSSLFGGAILGISLLDDKLKLNEYEVKSNRMIVPDPVKNKIYQERYQNYLKYYNLTLY